MKSVVSFLFVLIISFSLNAQVGIGTTTPQGALDVTSTTDGLLIPRVALVNTTTVTVVTGTESELVYNTTPASGTTDVSPGFYYLSTPAGPWVRLGDAASGPPPPPPPPTVTGWEITGNNDIVEGTNFLGTINDVDVVFRRDDDESGRISNNLTSFGIGAGEATTAAQNTAIGVDALTGNISGQSNTAIGHRALQTTANMSNCTAVGYNALQATSGQGNTALGYLAVRDNTSGEYNTGIGAESLLQVSQGSHNIGIGYQAGNLIATGDNNVVIGQSAGANIANGNNNIAIGFNAQVPLNTGNNQIRMGNTFITDADIQVGWTITSDRRWKTSIKDSGLGLDFLQTLRPVSYVRKNDNNKRTEYGFIAQELEEALSSAGDKNNAIISIDDAGMYGVRYNDFISITVKAVQEQQALIEKLQKDNEELKSVNTAILKRLEALENK